MSCAKASSYKNIPTNNKTLCIFDKNKKDIQYFVMQWEQKLLIDHYNPARKQSAVSQQNLALESMNRTCSTWQVQNNLENHWNPKEIGHYHYNEIHHELFMSSGHGTAFPLSPPCTSDQIRLIKTGRIDFSLYIHGDAERRSCLPFGAGDEVNLINKGELR